MVKNLQEIQLEGENLYGFQKACPAEENKQSRMDKGYSGN